MAFVPFDSTVRCAIRFTANGKNMVNTLWFRHLAEFGITEVQQLADALDLWAASSLVTQLSIQTTYQEVTCYDMRSEDSFVVINDDNTGAVGATTGDPASLASAMTVTLQTARRGRSYRGRNYISGWGESQLGSRTFNTGSDTNMENAYEDLLGSDFTGIGWTLVVASRQPGSGTEIVGVTTPVTAVRANLTIYSQRKRTH